MPFNADQAVPSFAGEVAAVTGGGSGIGAAICALLARAGGKVYSIDRSVPGSSREGIVDKVCDVSKPAQLADCIKGIAAAEGRLDHLVSNAGVWCGDVPMESVTEEEFDRVVGVNIKGTFFAISAAAPIMKAQGGGSIVVIGSDQSFVGKPAQQLYGLTKGAIAQLVKSCAAEYAADGVRVNCVCPGTVETPLVHSAIRGMADRAGDGDIDGRLASLASAQPFPRLGTPEEVAHSVAFISKIPFIVGAQLQVDGGYTCV